MKLLLFIFILFGLQAKANPVDFSGESVILMEQDSKRILYQKNIDEVHLTASIAKIMTAIVAIENGDLEKWCLVDEATINQVGSSIYLTKGDKIKLRDLLYGLMLRSGNDTAHLIAKSVGKDVDDFVIMMNNMAKKLKMTSSVFSNPSGLDEENYNYSTARDMAILMSYAMQNDEFRTITGTKRYIAKTFDKNVYEFYNKHRLVASGEANGGKTGYTKLAKRTLVSSFKKNGMELVVVTFNCGNDFNIHRSLSNYGFDNYDMVYVFKRGIIDIPEYSITPIVYEDVCYPLSKEEKLYCEIRLLRKPKESIVGIIYLKIDDKVVEKFNIYGYYR